MTPRHPRSPLIPPAPVAQPVRTRSARLHLTPVAERSEDDVPEGHLAAGELLSRVLRGGALIFLLLALSGN